MRGAFESIVVRRKGASTIDADGEGIWTASTTDTSYKGSIHQTSTEEAQPEEIGKYGERKRLTIRLPKNANVMNNDEIVILNYHSNVNGVYAIEGIFFTHTHLRLELRKTVQNV